MSLCYNFWRTLCPIGQPRRWPRPRWRRAIPSLVLECALGFALATAQNQIPPQVAIPTPEPIYAADANDSWNRIFCFLFSRRMDVRLSNEFPEGAPFTRDGVEVNLQRAGIQISTRTFDRTEVGDRAIEPLYPGSLDGSAARLVLSDAYYPGFTKALRDALHETGSRSLLARALMQNDLWAAHDIFFVPFLPTAEKTLGDRRREVVDLLAQLIRKIALTSEEIKSLSDNYPTAARQHSLPDLFHPEGGWIEVQWFPDRQHDRDAGYRRVSRIFLQPTPPRLGVQNGMHNDVQKFLDARPGQNATGLDGVALVMQLLLIDSQGNIRPTALTTDVRVLQYDRTPDGVLKKTALQVLEGSRRLFLRDPDSGGLVAEEENSPAYAVQNYHFANNYFETGVGQIHVGPPVQVTLRTRCAACHRDSNLTQIRTFAIAQPPHPPPVRPMNPASYDEADFDILQKKKQKDFAALAAYF